MTVWAAEVQSNTSLIWKNLMDLIPIVKALTACDLKDGAHASFWHDSWTAHGPLIDFVGSEGPRMLGIHVNANVADAIR
ncbi:hypothetical protein V5N11_015616 [Cardamine amara subsp. amara]|uniref:Uncharacterized protein n=1 Tax=Cardamine amara subsp. amara TaxID=228776 RepID=A0ABD1C5U9_CARAN